MQLDSFIGDTEPSTDGTIDEDFLDFAHTVEAFGRDREPNSYRSSHVPISSNASPSPCQDTGERIDHDSDTDSSDDYETAPLLENSTVANDTRDIRGPRSLSGYGATNNRSVRITENTIA